jgi:predicted transcriptional regulator
MIRKPKPTIQLNVRISPALNAQLEKLALKADVTKAAVVIGALKAHVERAGKC